MLFSGHSGFAAVFPIFQLVAISNQLKVFHRIYKKAAFVLTYKNGKQSLIH